jgi:hypothetical protein
MPLRARWRARVSAGGRGRGCGCRHGFGCGLAPRDGVQAVAVQDGTSGLVGDPQQQRGDRPVGQQGRPAERHERRRQSGERDDPRDATEDDEDLQCDRERQPQGEQLAEAVTHPQGRAQTALDEQAVEQQDREQPGQPELLGQRGDDEVALGEGDQPRPSLAQTGAEQPARGHPHEALGQLVGLGEGVGRERVQPEHHAPLQVREEQVCRVGAGREQHEADGDPGDPLGGDVEHRDEEAEEEQRRAQVFLKDEDGDAHQPGDHDRAEVTPAREGEAKDLAPGQGEDVAGLHEVAGEEHRESDLRNLPRLEGHRTDPDPDP